MKNLNVQESEKIFAQIMSGEMPEDKISEFLLALKEKGETADEILGAVNVLQRNMLVPDYYPENIIDTCGTGGDGLDTLNISTATAFVVAGADVKVMKHGNRAVSSKSGSADVLKELGVKVEGKLTSQLISEADMIFLYAPVFHPIMKRVIEVRKKLQTRTIFNLLGPLLNPAHAKKQLIGVYDAKYLRIFAEVLQKLGTKKAWIVHGAGGLDEISISGETQVCELDKGAIDTFTITPEDAGLRRYDVSEIKGGTATENAQAILELLKGKSGAYCDIVLLNAAAGLIVAGKADDLKHGVALAKKSIDSGRALQVLEKLREITK